MFFHIHIIAFLTQQTPAFVPESVQKLVCVLFAFNVAYGTILTRRSRRTMASGTIRRSLILIVIARAGNIRITYRFAFVCIAAASSATVSVTGRTARKSRFTTTSADGTAVTRRSLRIFGRVTAMCFCRLVVTGRIYVSATVTTSRGRRRARALGIASRIGKIVFCTSAVFLRYAGRIRKRTELARFGRCGIAKGMA